MRPGRPIQMTLSITAAATPVISLIDGTPETAPGSGIFNIIPQGKINIPKHKRVINSPGVQAQDLAGPNWNGAPMLTGRNYDSPQAGGRTRSISIRNMEAAGGDDIQISFDRGANFFTLQPQESFADEVSIQFFTIRRPTVASGNIIRVEVKAILG